MVAIEYQVVLPFTLSEVFRGLRFLCARQTEEIMTRSANGETATLVDKRGFFTCPDVVLEKGRYPERKKLCTFPSDLCLNNAVPLYNNEKPSKAASYVEGVNQREHSTTYSHKKWYDVNVGSHFSAGRQWWGTYIHNEIYLGSRFPRWVRSILPEAAMWLSEECWIAYPYVFTRYTSRQLPNHLDYTIESIHIEGQARKERVFTDMSAEETASCKVELLDIAAPSTAAASTPGVDEGDPTKIISLKFPERAPLSGKQWWLTQSDGPITTVYKRASCGLRHVPFNSKIEKLVLDSTV